MGGARGYLNVAGMGGVMEMGNFNAAVGGALGQAGGALGGGQGNSILGGLQGFAQNSNMAAAQAPVAVRDLLLRMQLVS